MKVQIRQGAKQLLLAVTMLLGLSLSARADTLTPAPDINDPDLLLFNFNSPALANGANNLAVQTYMNTRMGNPGNSPGQPGVVVGGATASHTYDGEGHVVGPCGSLTSAAVCDGTTGTGTSKPLVTPITLGTTDFYVGGLLATGDLHAPTDDGFLYTWGTNYISFTFHDLDFVPTQFGVDWQMFPAVGNNPDFTIRVCNGPGPCVTDGSDDVFGKLYGLVPGAASPYAEAPGTPYTESRCTDRRTATSTNQGGFNGEANASPCTNSGQETYKQLIGSTGLIDVSAFLSPGSTYRFEFWDWPNTIGIDNFYMPPEGEVPEPASLILLGTGLLGIGRQWRKKQQAKKQNQNVV